jgi:hypothetical protein
MLVEDPASAVGCLRSHGKCCLIDMRRQCSHDDRNSCTAYIYHLPFAGTEHLVVPGGAAIVQCNCGLISTPGSMEMTAGGCSMHGSMALHGPPCKNSACDSRERTLRGLNAVSTTFP